MKIYLNLHEKEFRELCSNLKSGVPMATPVFDGASEKEIKAMLELAGLPASGQTTLSMAELAMLLKGQLRLVICTCLN